VTSPNANSDIFDTDSPGNVEHTKSQLNQLHAQYGQKSTASTTATYTPPPTPGIGAGDGVTADATSLTGLSTSLDSLPSDLVSALPPQASGRVTVPTHQVMSWQRASGGGYMAAVVPGADDSLVSALMAAANAGRMQAALMANTVTLDGTKVMAGGPALVGSRNTPASALVYGSEAGRAPQFHGGAHWFWPVIKSWRPPTVNEGEELPEVDATSVDRVVNSSLKNAFSRWSGPGDSAGAGAGDATSAGVGDVFEALGDLI
jgi:hypothetical protein